MMLSRRGMPRLSQMLAGYGRNGDTMLAHINPQEARMLQARGGAGTVNPMTGLREFYVDKGAFGGAGGFGSGGAMGAGGFGGSGTGSADKSGSGVGKKGSFGGAGLGGQVAGGFSGAGTGSMSKGAPQSENVATGLTAKAKQGLDLGIGPIGAGTSVLGGVLGGPLGMGIGLIGGLLDRALGLGNVSIGGQSVTDARNAGYNGTRGFSSGGMSRGAEGPGRVFGEGRQSPRGTGTNQGGGGGSNGGLPPGNPSPNPAPVVGTLPQVPDWLKQFAGDNLLPVQLRSLIATQGSQGLDSAFRDMATLDYYRKLLKGSVQNYGQILPVEHRYLQDVYGFQYQPTLQDLYRIIGA